MEHKCDASHLCQRREFPGLHFRQIRTLALKGLWLGCASKHANIAERRLSNALLILKTKAQLGFKLNRVRHSQNYEIVRVVTFDTELRLTASVIEAYFRYLHNTCHIKTLCISRNMHHKRYLAIGNFDEFSA